LTLKAKKEDKTGVCINTSAGTIGALTAVAASSPFKAPTTASAISIATPSCTLDPNIIRDNLVREEVKSV
jgi:hypothetical protein